MSSTTCRRLTKHLRSRSCKLRIHIADLGTGTPACGAPCVLLMNVFHLGRCQALSAVTASGVQLRHCVDPGAARICTVWTCRTPWQVCAAGLELQERLLARHDHTAVMYKYEGCRASAWHSTCGTPQLTMSGSPPLEVLLSWLATGNGVAPTNKRSHMCPETIIRSHHTHSTL